MLNLEILINISISIANIFLRESRNVRMHAHASYLALFIKRSNTYSVRKGVYNDKRSLLFFSNFGAQVIAMAVEEKEGEV